MTIPRYHNGTKELMKRCYPKLHKLKVKVMVMLKEFVRIRIIEDGKAISEVSSGDDLWRKKNRWMNLNRVIDWRNDRYQKTIPASP